MQTKLNEIWLPLQLGSIDIEQWWKDNEEYISSISSVDTADEVSMWSASYFRYGDYLFEKGNFNESLCFINKSIDILYNNKDKLNEKEFNDNLEIVLKSKTDVLYQLGKYWDAYKNSKTLCKLFPANANYRIGKKNLLRASLLKIFNPIFIIFICIWLLMLLDEFVFKTNYLPALEIWAITWGLWLVGCIIYYVSPYIIDKLEK